MVHAILTGALVSAPNNTHKKKHVHISIHPFPTDGRHSNPAEDAQKMHLHASHPKAVDRAHVAPAAARALTDHRKHAKQFSNRNAFHQRIVTANVFHQRSALPGHPKGQRYSARAQPLTDKPTAHRAKHINKANVIKVTHASTGTRQTASMVQDAKCTSVLIGT